MPVRLCHSHLVQKNNTSLRVCVFELCFKMSISVVSTLASVCVYIM